MFKVGDKEYKLNKATARNRFVAKTHWNKTYREELESGALLRGQLNSYLSDRKLWTDEMEAKLGTLQRVIDDGEKSLEEGNIQLTAAKEIAIDMLRARNDQNEILANRQAMDANTAEAQADDAQFNCVIQQTLVYNDSGDLVFTNMDEYMNSEDAELLGAAFSNAMSTTYGDMDDYQRERPEIKFLQEFKFMDKKFNLLNEDGQTIDLDGNVIETVDATPKKKKRRKPFLGADGEPVKPVTKK